MFASVKHVLKLSKQENNILQYAIDAIHKEVSLRILLAKTNLVCPSYVMLGFCKKKI